MGVYGDSRPTRPSVQITVGESANDLRNLVDGPPRNAGKFADLVAGF